MEKQLQRLQEIENKAKAIGNSVSVNCEDSSKHYSELCELANELGVTFNAMESSS